MPNTASAKKRLRQNDARRLRNRSSRSEMRTSIRKVREAVQAGDADLARTTYITAQKKLDKAAAKGLIHRNAAARSKSRLNRMVKELVTGGSN